MNVVSQKYMLNKTFAEDLTEGKFSFPIIHCIRSKPEDTKLLNILKQRTEDVNLKKFAVKWMYVILYGCYHSPPTTQVHRVGILYTLLNQFSQIIDLLRFSVGLRPDRLTTRAKRFFVFMHSY